MERGSPTPAGDENKNRLRGECRKAAAAGVSDPRSILLQSNFVVEGKNGFDKVGTVLCTVSHASVEQKIFPGLT